MFPSYEFLQSLANGMVKVDFTSYLNSGVITKEQFNALTKQNEEAVKKFNELFD